jgi:hypothetical protein
MRLEKERFLVPTSYKKPRSKFAWLGITYELRNQGRRATPIIVEEGDFVYLMVSPMRGLCCFKIRGKLVPRFIGSFMILEKGGEVPYQLELSPQLSDVHDVFHVSQLKKCLHVPEEQIPMEDLDAKEDPSYQDYPIKILETSERVTQNKRIKMCKVQ